MIALNALAIHAGKFRLEDISFQTATGEYVVLMGKTGCGKTALLEAICGLKPVRRGSIYLHGRDVTHLKPAERGIGYVPQDLALFPTLTVREHLAFALMVRRWEQAAIERRVGELSELLGIRPLLDRKPHGLSGGEAQRVALGRALAFRPAVLLLDEPLSALDDETRADMAALLRSVQKLTGVTALHVTHSMGEAKKLADRLLVLKNGAIEEAPRSSGWKDAAPNESIRGAEA
ncbi:MAG TPA: ABC transporter ATP-binding protein [Gemmataceae bacterium]|jgi:ABC-type sugar transport system ATPase subunit